MRPTRRRQTASKAPRSTAGSASSCAVSDAQESLQRATEAVKRCCSSFPLRAVDALRLVAEADLASAVHEYLNLRQRQGDLRWSTTDAGSKERRERGRRVFAGWSDITACVRGGRFLGIELKRPVGGETSTAQLKFREAIRALGGIAVEVRSVAEVKAAIEEASR